MSFASERRVLSSGNTWSISVLSDMMWSFFNAAYFFFRSLIEPLAIIGDNQNSRSRSGRGNSPWPPRPPRGGGGGGFRSFSDNIAPPGNFPMAGG